MELTKENYFSKEAEAFYCGSTQYKTFMTCEAQAMAKIKGLFTPEQSDACLIGHAVHAWNEGKLTEFKDAHPEMYKKDGNLQAKFIVIDECINAIKDDATMLKALSGTHEVILTGELFGLPFKIMIDSYNPTEGFFTDLKCVRDFEPVWTGRKKENFIRACGYDVQMAIYADIEKQASKRTDYLFPHIAAVTKQSPPDKAVFIGFKDEIENILLDIELNVRRIADIKSGKIPPESCGKCEYCRSVKKAQFVDYRN